jgi:hypothetical protein
MSPHAAEGKGRDLVAVGIIGAARIAGRAVHVNLPADAAREL